MYTPVDLRTRTCPDLKSSILDIAQQLAEDKIGDSIETLLKDDSEIDDGDVKETIFTVFQPDIEVKNVPIDNTLYGQSGDPILGKKRSPHPLTSL